MEPRKNAQIFIKCIISQEDHDAGSSLRRASMYDLLAWVGSSDSMFPIDSDEVVEARSIQLLIQLASTEQETHPRPLTLCAVKGSSTGARFPLFTPTSGDACEFTILLSRPQGGCIHEQEFIFPLVD